MRTSCPELGAYLDWAILALRIVVAFVFLTSGAAHMRHPHERAKSLGLSVGVTVVLGAAEVLASLGILFGVLTQWAALGLILIMLGAIAMKVTKWKTGFWGDKNSGWHYDLLFVVMSAVILTSNGGRFVLLH